MARRVHASTAQSLNAPTGAWCSLTRKIATVAYLLLRLNAPTGAWCSLTERSSHVRTAYPTSQCTYRCVVLPDPNDNVKDRGMYRLNAPTGAWCSLTSTPRYTDQDSNGLNAPTGAWCSLTKLLAMDSFWIILSQCTYRCVVLPDPCPRERWYDATSRARSATGPGSTPPDRPAPGPE